MARPTRSQAMGHLQRAFAEICQLKKLEPEIQTLPMPHVLFPPKFERWRRDTKVSIKNIFSDEPDYIKQFDSIRFSHSEISARISEAQHKRTYHRGLDLAAAIITSMHREVVEYWTDDEQPSMPSGSQSQVSDRKSTKKVFVVHGRDLGTRDSIARFLENLGLNPVILSDLPAKGQTIIEKFNDNSDVEFAVALLTPEDAGSLSGDTQLSPRARQNVIFELGFFIGKLGRDKVCVLTKGDPEIPSDYAGVEYIPLDDHGAWKMELFKELREAGFNIDADRLVDA